MKMNIFGENFMNRILSFLKRTHFINKKKNRYLNRELNTLCSEIAFVEFWFFSENEENLYKLATHLVQNGYTIPICEPNDDGGGFLCLALSKIDPEPEKFERLVVDMQIIAENHGSQLDGWLRS